MISDKTTEALAQTITEALDTPGEFGLQEEPFLELLAERGATQEEVAACLEVAKNCLGYLNRKGYLLDYQAMQEVIQREISREEYQEVLPKNFNLVVGG